MSIIEYMNSFMFFTLKDYIISEAKACAYF